MSPKFKEWFKKQKIVGEIDPDMIEDSWNACKEEITRIIFLNSHQNGEFRCDIRRVLEEIENL